MFDAFLKNKTGILFIIRQIVVRFPFKATEIREDQ